MSLFDFIIVSLIDSFCNYEGLSVYKQICKSINNYFCRFEECWFNFCKHEMKLFKCSTFPCAGSMVERSVCKFPQAVTKFIF